MERMAVSFRYWNECIDPEDMESMWNTPSVSAEWLDAGETRGQKVHLSRDPDGQVYLTQTEMKAVAEIVISRHFGSRIDPADHFHVDSTVKSEQSMALRGIRHCRHDMICAISELESDRQPLAQRYEKKAKATSLGIMHLLPKTAEWLSREMGYQSYHVEGNHSLLFKPFVNVYFGAAYLKWLSIFENKERSEEFVVRAYKGGTKKATHKSTLPYWQRYLSVKESLPSRKSFEGHPSPNNVSASTVPPSLAAPAAAPSQNTGGGHYTYWDSRASPEDMEDMWNHPEVLKEWAKTGERRGKVRFSHDEKKRPYLSRVELKAVADIILIKHFSTKPMKASVLCALAEVISLRFVNGIGPRAGIMGIDYSTASWLYTEMGFRAYRVDSVNDISKPFLSMYFGAAYIVWLAEFEGRLRTPQYVIQAYISGRKNVNVQETGTQYLKFEEALSHYEDTKKPLEDHYKDHGSCNIM